MIGSTHDFLNVRFCQLERVASGIFECPHCAKINLVKKQTLVLKPMTPNSDLIVLIGYYLRHFSNNFFHLH